MIPLSKKEERVYGADVKIESIAPLYIQFKRSLAYSSTSSAKFIADRKNLNLEVEPKVLYFELRKKDKNHKDFQHNLLFDLREKLHEEEIGDAVYSAPLFLSRSAYLLAVHLNSILHWRPWHFYYKYPFFDQEFNIVTRTGSIRFQNCPALRDHITIPPHTKVETYKHRYSFLESGKQACFHSPTTINNNVNLGQFVYDFLGFSNGQPTTNMLNINESVQLLNGLNLICFDESFGEIKIDSILDRWLDFGDRLKEVYNIEQYMLIKFEE